MNSRTSRYDRTEEPAGDLEQRLRDDLVALHHLPVPPMSFDPLASRVLARKVEPNRRWRPALAAAIALAGVTILAGGSSLFGGSSEVSAQELLEKTHAIAAMDVSVLNDVSYHLVARNQSFGPPGMQAATVDTTTETWYQDPQNQRTESFDENGNLVFGSSRNGDDLWFYSAGDRGNLRVVQSAVGTNGFIAFSAADFGAKDLAGLLEMYSGSCARAEKVGEETVAGRDTYVIEVTQTPDTCELKPVITTDGDLTTVKVEAAEGMGFGAGAAVASVGVASTVEGGEPSDSSSQPEVQFRIVETTTRMWVDQETFITLKTETESDEGLLFRYEVTEFEVDPEFEPGTFVYEPPPGAEVREADGPDDMKLFLTGGGSVENFESAPGGQTGGDPNP